MEAPWVLPHEMKNPDEVTHFNLDGRRLYLLKRGELDDRRDSIFRIMVSLSELAESWQQMADSSVGALQGLVGEAVEKLPADKALALPKEDREDIVLTIKHDKTRVPLRPIESWYGKSPVKDTEVRVGGCGE
ncbi:hypothetical protein NSK_005193 [Nannochloropsis salina CCMP1776]|jgi:hypothetical protein|uniref:Uncharacterized protein n=1 Tax=Nannochloropsis salina CCMP1776 TaxID=1027361 RepID=A0A4D9CW36_9STRA|nr:hypothetical protein NSK_005193 [Nannochloropsis salina CCMP1776]|eukprot:TFJ83511.1 hypothetical protein NSK_005193 [Nannochloropsis salina CCMP1776]